MKKLLCVLLCAVLLLGVLVSCGKKTDDPNKDNESTSQNAGNNGGGDEISGGEDEGSSESETTRKQDIVVEDFSQGGVARDFTMMVRIGRNHYLYAEKDSTDHVVHGTFLRNTRVENDYGIKIKIYEPSGTNNSKPDAFIAALAGSTGQYDLCVPDYWWLLEHQGFFINLFDRDELGFNQGGLNQDYWYTSWNDNTTVNNKLYTVVGDASLEILENIEVIYFNKAMTNSLGLDMYQLVNDKEWTLDQMNDIGKQFAGGSETTDTSDDSYGVVVDNHSTAAMIYTSGIKLTEIDEYGAISLIAQSRGVNSEIHAKLKEIFLSTDNYWDKNTARSNVGVKTNLFVNGKTAFYANCLYVGGNITKSASEDFEFGILPAPLYAEGDDYISTAYGVSVFGIPKSSVDLHFSAMILDALNFHSWNTVVSGFFDSSMKAQLAAGSDDAKMLDLARNNLYFDFAWILQTGGKMTVHGAFQGAFAETKDLATNLTAAMEVSVPGLGEIMAFYTKD